MEKHSTRLLFFKKLAYLPPAEKRDLFIKDLSFAIFFSIVSILVYYKCRYGFGNIDESFYLVTPLRLWQGDALFAEEWHLSQTSSILLLPLIDIFLHLTGSTTGIILTMRYVCTSVQVLTALFLYFRFRCIHWLGASLSSISFLLYTPFGIMALSYNSMGIVFLTLSMVFISTSVRFQQIQYILSGICLSAAVLCCPFLAVLYVLYGLIVISAHWAKKPKASDSLWRIPSLAFLSIGILLSALAFILFILSRASLQEIIDALPYIFNDPEHPHIPLVSKVQDFVQCILYRSPLCKPVSLILLFLFSICIIDRNRTKHPLIYVIPSVLSVICLLCDFAIRTPYINFIMWPINLLTPFAFLLSSSKQIRKAFFSLYLPGMIYSFCLHLSSNQRFYAISSASSVATVSSILILCLFSTEWHSHRSPNILRIISTLCLCVLFLLQFKYQSRLRYQSVFWEHSLSEQTEYIDDGIYKGLYISKEKEALYSAAVKQMEQLALFADSGDNALFLSENTWYYLMNDYKVASYSGWLSGIHAYTLDRLESYYSLNPDKIPDIVFADSIHHAIAQDFSNRFQYAMHPIENGIILTKPSP